MKAKQKTKKTKIEDELEVPQGVEVSIKDGIVTVKGKNGSNSRSMMHPIFKIASKDGKVIFSADRDTKRERKMIGSYKAHLKNMMRGVQEKYVYKMKICAGHFPVTVTVAKNEIIVKNFLGEKVPRTAKLREDVTVKVDGDQITVESIDKEAAGSIAGKIESLTRITNRDRRIFQDGIYITSKDGKAIG